jgi:hypothetical protein
MGFIEECIIALIVVIRSRRKPLGAVYVHYCMIRYRHHLEKGNRRCGKQEEKRKKERRSHFFFLQVFVIHQFFFSN